MAGFTDALEQALLDHILNDPAYTPDITHIGLSTTTPTEAGGNFTEPVGNGYARVATAAADWSAASGAAPAQKVNTAVKTFPTATGSWGTVTHFGLFTASSGGTLRVWGALTTSKTIDNGDTASFAASSIEIQLGDPGDTYG
jgi:hypothetical protein